MKPVRQIIAANIKKRRIEMGFSQQDFADMIGLSRMSVINIESGRHMLTAEKLFTVCCLFNISPNQMFPTMKPIKPKRKLVDRIIIKQKYQYLPVK